MYGRDEVLIAILHGEDRKIAESPVDRREGGRGAAATLGYYQGGYYQSNGGHFSLGRSAAVLRRAARAGAAPGDSARPPVVEFSIDHDPKKARPRT